MLQVQRWDAGRDGVPMAGRIRQRFEAQGLWVTECRYQPGVQQPAVTAEHDSLQVVLTGLLKIVVDGESTILGAGDTLFVPRGGRCELEAVGSTPVVAYVAAFLANGPRTARAPHLGFLESIWR